MKLGMVLPEAWKEMHIFVIRQEKRQEQLKQTENKETKATQKEAQ